MVAQPVKAEGLRKSFRDGSARRDVLDGVSLTVSRGELVGVMGPSGSGKTTLLSICAGLLAPDEGALWLGGNAVDFGRPARIAALRAEHVGVMIPSFGLHPRERVLANVELPLLYHRPAVRRAERVRRAQEALSSVGLADLMRRRADTLSAGETQRVMLARALVGRPALLVADEPTSSLDSAAAEQIVELLVGLSAQGLAILVATHDDRVARACFRTLHLSDGQLGSARP